MGKLYPVVVGDPEADVRPVDVSARGLGFLTKQQLRAGGIYWLDIAGIRSRVEIAYCTKHLGIDGLFRCGLFLREEKGSLLASFREMGLIASDPTP